VNWTDSHCHLADERIATSVDSIIERSKTAGINRWVQGGIDPADWKRQRDLRDRFGEGIVPCFGIHPWTSSKLSPSELRSMLDLLEKELTHAPVLGEAGLDFGDRFSGTEKSQIAAFNEQLALARSLQKPLALHIVKAHEKALEILESQPPFSRGGWVHLYSGSYEIARRYIDRGFVISVGGPVSRPKGFETLKRAIPKLPSDSLLLETDCPDQDDDPTNLIGIAKAVGVLRKEDFKLLLDRSSRNIERFL
jgi:TatD DNase family protein